MSDDSLVIPALILALVAAIASSSPAPREEVRAITHAIGAAFVYGSEHADGDTPMLGADDER
jgi:hypothetical protein